MSSSRDRVRALAREPDTRRGHAPALAMAPRRHRARHRRRARPPRRATCRGSPAARSVTPPTPRPATAPLPIAPRVQTARAAADRAPAARTETAQRRARSTARRPAAFRPAHSVGPSKDRRSARSRLYAGRRRARNDCRRRQLETSLFVQLKRASGRLTGSLGSLARHKSN